jgi:F0F1-type ATP synthase delta subunit
MPTNLDIKPEEILSLCRTRREAMDLIEALDEVLVTSYKINVNLNEHMRAVFPYTTYDTMMLLIRDHEIDIKDAHILYKFLHGIKDIVTHLPTVVLSLAFTPTPRFLDRISGWLFENFKEPILLDLVIDQELAGGAVVAFKGLYKDYSLRKRLETLFQNHES